MHFKLIFFLFMNLFYAQSLYESSVGINSSSISARSTALGSTAAVTDLSALSISSNPSNMIISKRGFSIISNYQGSFVAERRGMVVKDYFGDYLAEADYVKNSSIINSLTFGASYNFQINDFNFSTGISMMPYNIFNYSYEEEVRGKLASDDGNIFSRDPLLGYHVLKSKGDQKLFSIGHAVKFKLINNIVASIGYGYNMLDQSTINEEVYIDTIIAEDNLELSLVPPYNIAYKLDKVSFSSFGCNLKFEQILLNFSFRDEFIISRSMIDDSYTDFESYLSALSSLYGSNELASHFFFNYIELKFLDEIHKPKTYNVSLAILDASNQNFNFIVNYEKNIYDADYTLSSYERYSIGVEHFGFNNLPLRFGVQYMSSPFRPYISSSSVVSFGSGFNINSNLTLDYAFDYKSTNYMFPDLFPVEDENRPELDIVNESETNFVITMSYNF